MKYTVTLDEDSLDTIIRELNNGIYGDGDPYDKKLERLANKLKKVKEKK